MSKVKELSTQIKREKLRILDRCMVCKENIYSNEIYYDISGKIICEDCITTFKKEGNEIE